MTTWVGFMLVHKKESLEYAYLDTARNCALQAYQAGIDQSIFKDSLDAAKKHIEIAYVEITRRDK